MQSDNKGQTPKRSADAKRASVPATPEIRKKRMRLIILACILLVAGGLYVWKNPIGQSNNPTQRSGDSYYDSAVFDLDATIGFDLEAILAHKLPTIVDFGADSCEPCKAMAPHLAELNQELRGKAVIKFVDVNKNPQAAQQVLLSAIPTQFFFHADGSPYVPADQAAAAASGFVLYSLRTTGEHVLTAHMGYLDKQTMFNILKEMGME
jgi:thioredoxin 1